MGTKSLGKTNQCWPFLFENTGWLDRFFNTSLDEYFNFGKIANVPSINLSETDNAYELTLATPGLEREDIKVEIGESMLTISAEKEEKEKSSLFVIYAFKITCRGTGTIHDPSIFPITDSRTGAIRNPSIFEISNG